MATTLQEVMMDRPLDELENDQLTQLTSTHTEGFVARCADELERVESVIQHYVLTGAPLDYWFDRQRILVSLVSRAQDGVSD